MEWYKDGVNITVPKDKRLKIEDNKLVIEDPKDEDAGNYTCRAVLTKGNGTIGERLIEVIGKSEGSISLHKLYLLFLYNFVTAFSLIFRFAEEDGFCIKFAFHFNIIII